MNRNYKHRMLGLSLAFLLFSYLSIFSSANGEKIDFFKPIINTLISEGVDSAFIHSLILHKNVNFNEKFVKINVSSVLKKGKTDYSKHYNKRAVNKTKIFIEENHNILESAEKIYKVPKEVIASILWVETRHGGYTGNNNVVSVFLSTAMANEAKYLDMNIKVIQNEYKGDKATITKLTKKIRKRALKKSKWAMTEIKALEKLSMISPIEITDIQGSWAGAFGLSQFLPSSYMAWAVDGNYDGEINLFDKTDAIYSVGNYLKTNGWGNSTKQKRKAVYHYNHSNAYVDAVLKLADLSK